MKKLTLINWATLDECAHALASMPGSLPKDRIKRELVKRIAQGEIKIQFDADTWSRDDLLTIVTGEYVNEAYVSEQIDLARKHGNAEAVKTWRAKKKTLPRYTPDYSFITIDRLPAHIIAGLELWTRDVQNLRPDRSSIGKRGPKRKYDADAFEAAALDLLKRNGGISRSFTNGAFKAAMQEWCLDNWKTEPRPTWLKEHLSSAIGKYSAVAN